MTVTPTDGTQAISATIAGTCGFTSVVIYYKGEPDNTTYNVTVASDITGGTVTANPTSAKAGAIITLTASPTSNFEFDAWNVTNSSTKADIAVIDGWFIMPESDVDVSATFSGETGLWTAATMAAGTNGSAAKVNEKNAIKVGTSSASGNMTIKVPEGATKLKFYASAWTGVTGLKLNITPTANVTNPSIDLIADTGISGNSPYTLIGSEESYEFEIDLKDISAETTLTFNPSIAKRFVVWGAVYCK